MILDLAEMREWLRIVSARLVVLILMNELIFLVEEAPEGGFIARALGASIFTQADTEDELRTNVREASECHYGEAEAPRIIRLHFVREEVLTT